MDLVAEETRTWLPLSTSGHLFTCPVSALNCRELLLVVEGQGFFIKDSVLN